MPRYATETSLPGFAARLSVPEGTACVEPGCAADAEDFAGPATAAEHSATPQTGTPRLLHAAAGLLRALAAIQCADEAPAQGLKALHDRLAQEVLEFSRICDRAGLRHEHMLAARYALCTALDEALNRKPWAGGEHVSVGPWSQYALLQEFHQEGEGGTTVFLLIGRLAAQPQEHRDVLEVMLHILALGFMGDYGCRVDGSHALEQVRQRLSLMLGGTQAPIEFTRHARPLPAPAMPTRWRRLAGRIVPVLVLGALLALGTLWRNQLQRESASMRESLVGLRGAVDTALERSPRAPGTSSTADRESDPRAWLDAAVRAGRVDVQPESGGWRIAFRGDDMFAPGSSALEAGVLAPLAQVAAAVRSRPTSVLVLGYTDDTSRGRKPSINQELSQRRADAVARQLVLDGVPAEHLHALGRGSSDPRGDNSTPRGRARNRRVDIVLGPQGFEERAR